MAIYDYKCEVCGEIQEAFNHIAARDTSAPLCCDKATIRQLSAPMVFVPDWSSYKCPVTDQIVSSERQRRNIMAEHRLVDANDFTPKYVVERKKAKTAANNALAEKLTADIPKEIIQQASELMESA